MIQVAGWLRTEGTGELHVRSDFDLRTATVKWKNGQGICQEARSCVFKCIQFFYLILNNISLEICYVVIRYNL